MAKSIACILWLAALFTGPGATAQALPPLQPEQDACGALTLCSGRFHTPFSYRGRG
jgi:hypothetical protein